MSSRSLRLELAPSYRLALLFFALHGAAAACLAVVVPGWLKLLAVGFVGGVGVLGVWKHALLRAPSSVRGLHVAGTACEVRLASGEAMAVELAARRYVGRHLVLLPLRRPVRRTILVSRDMLDADSFRRLRIWALWGKLPAAQAKRPPVARAQLPT